MENDKVFRKIGSKLAGFESDIREDAWQSFEKHRLRKERKRKLVGALGVGMLLLCIFGALIGLRALLEQKRLTAKQSNKPVVAMPKHRAESKITKTEKAGETYDLRSRTIGLQNGLNRKTDAGAFSVKYQVNASGNPTVAVPAVFDLMPVPNDSLATSSTSASRLFRISEAPPKTGPWYYDVNLQLPAIYQGEEHKLVNTAPFVRSFQLSAGAAMRANYTRPTNNRLTLGPAVFSTFSITPKLAIRGGLALMREHANVSNPTPALTKDAVKWLNRGDYLWWNLETPVDFQITLHRKPKYRLSGLLGVSSSLYWGEHFRELYQKDKIVTTTFALHNGEVREIEGLVSKREEPVSGRNSRAVFAPATYFNASVILEKRISPGSLLAIEPQFRYPIGGVTSHNLKFTSIGLQIRIVYK